MFNSILMRNVAPFIQSRDPNMLRMDLLHASHQTEVRWNANNLDEAFTWNETPQGALFWSTINRECVENRVILRRREEEI